MCNSLWLNPPFSLKKPFLTKLENEYADGKVREALVLVPIAIGTRWWAQFVAHRYWCGWNRRIAFIGAPDHANFDIALVYYGRDFYRFYSVFKEHGLVYGPALNRIQSTTPLEPVFSRVEDEEAVG